jgi:uncharacterized protein
MKSQLRHFALARQGLLTTQCFADGAAGARQAIEHLAYVQIDTISMIERAHHHVLWSRVPGYQTEQLNQLLAERHIFEYWFHAAAYLPIRDYRFALRRMAAVRNSNSPYYREINSNLCRDILQRVRDEGPLRARHLDSSPNGGWWNFGPSKRALEKLFMQGDLMVSERVGMEKVYDLRERLLPAGLNVQEPDMNEFVAYLLQSHLRAHGVVTLEQLTHLHTDKAVKSAMRQLLAEQVHSGILGQLSDIPNTYIETAALDQIECKENTALHLLSPFDNAVIHRKRLSQLFAFEYRLECYVPPAKREFGYFCLPILFGNHFVGRIDCKAHRRQKILEVLSIHLEAELADMNIFAQQLMLKLQPFAEFNGCDTIEIRQVDQALRQLLPISVPPA